MIKVEGSDRCEALLEFAYFKVLQKFLLALVSAFGTVYHFAVRQKLKANLKKHYLVHSLGFIANHWLKCKNLH